MPEDLAGGTLESREAATFRALVDGARMRQVAAHKRSPLPPRFLLESARSMAEHMSMSAQEMEEHLAPMALWQLYLSSALAGWDFADIRENMPWSYERVRAALAPIEWRPQLVSTVFHMAAFPITSVLIGAVWRDMHQGPLHLLVAGRNRAFLKLDDNRWVSDAIEVVSTDPAGLRTLLSGLKSGAIRRLLILADGPEAPGSPGTRALHGVSPALAIRTSLLSKVHSLGIPLVPITHEWHADRLVVTPQPLLDPAELSEVDTMDAVAGHIEDLLRRHPEQWLNWGGARIRT